MGMLRRINIDGAIIIGAVTRIPVLANIAGSGSAYWPWYCQFLFDIEQLKPNIGVLGVGDHVGPCPVYHGVPGIKATDPASLF